MFTNHPANKHVEWDEEKQRKRETYKKGRSQSKVMDWGNWQSSQIPKGIWESSKTPKIQRYAGMTSYRYDSRYFHWPTDDKYTINLIIT